MTDKIVVYTCVTNDYDHIGEHEYADGVDYLFFHDGTSSPIEDRWQPIKLNETWVPLNLDPRRRAKYPKCWPWFSTELKEYDYAIWIDGSMQITDPDFPFKMLEYMKSGWIISPHFDERDCAYGEATIRPLKYANEPLDEQIEHYRKEGFPEHQGLYECGVMARDMANPKVEEVGRFWLRENLEWSYQDQVSLPYILWKTGFKPDVLPTSWRDTGWLYVNAHKSEE